MGYENVLAAIVALMGGIAMLIWHSRNAGKDSERLKQAEAKIARDREIQAHIEKERKRAEEAKDAGVAGTAYDSAQLSDEEYRATFGYDRPYSNS